MPHFILAYHGVPKSADTPEEGAKQMARWGAWLQGLGDAVINPGSPLSSWKNVTANSISDGTDPDPMNGFTIIDAPDLEAALAMTKSCPYLDMGNMRVAQIKKM